MIKEWWKISMMIVIWQNDDCNITKNKNKIRINPWDKQVNVVEDTPVSWMFVYILAHTQTVRIMGSSSPLIQLL